MNFTTLSIIIPAYNEEATIHLILDRVKAVQLIQDIQKEIIIVNDCSKDDTKGAIHRYMQNNPELDMKYYEHTVNKGKGAALHGVKPASNSILLAFHWK